MSNKRICITRHSDNIPHKATVLDLDRQTIENSAYRRVIFTYPHLMQLVLMSITKDQDIGFEIHKKTDQFIKVEVGKGLAILDGIRFKISIAKALLIPSGVRHNIVNTFLVRRWGAVWC